MSYGIFKQLAGENHYSSLTKALNSASSTEKTQKTIKRITKKEIAYAHMGQLVIRDGICYATFLQNPGSDGEAHASETSGIVLAVFAVDAAMKDDFCVERDITFYPLGGKGDYCAGHRAASIFKDNSMCMVGELLHICFSFTTEDNNSHIFCKIFDTTKQAWSGENKVTLCYNNAEYDFSDETINRIYKDKGYAPRAKGLIELVSAWSEYNGEYYATGITIEGPNNGFVVKTSDFVSMQLVDVVPFNDMGTAEIASYVYRDALYVACRQDYGIPYLYVGMLDLKSMQWKHHYKIPDGNSRPWFFERKDGLYLMNTVQEAERRYANISRVRTMESNIDFFKYMVPVECVATLKDCGYYYATASHNGEVYFVCTKNTESFGKLVLELHDEEEINQKLLGLFASRQ